MQCCEEYNFCYQPAEIQNAAILSGESKTFKEDVHDVDQMSGIYIYIGNGKGTLNSGKARVIWS